MGDLEPIRNIKVEVAILTKRPAEHATAAEEFDAFLGEFVSVRKAEIDAEESKSKAMRERLKAKGEAKGEKQRKSPPKT